MSTHGRTFDPIAQSAPMDAPSRIMRPAGPQETDARRLLEENEGLAQEVLRGYEQLNLIFEFTQGIVGMTRADDMVNALLGSLARALHAPCVGLECGDGSRRLYDAVVNQTDMIDGVCGLENALSNTVELVRRERSVLVRTIGELQVILGALPRSQGRVDVVSIVRPSSIGVYTAGDVLMAQSILSFGSQIIRNSDLHQQVHQLSMGAARALVAAIDKKDHYTKGHSDRVGVLASRTGAELGIHGEELQQLEWSAVLHDVGKIGVPEAILQKTGKLTPEEFAIVKRHPVMGHEILKPVQLSECVLNGVLYHHENPDGSGYPNGLTGDSIPQFARIIHVVDVFDALSSNRSYRSAHTFDQAMEIVRADAGTKLDRATVDAFIRVAGAMRGALSTMYVGEAQS